MTSEEKAEVLQHLEGLAKLISSVGDRGGTDDRANLAVLANALDVLSDGCDYAAARADVMRALEMFRAGPVLPLARPCSAAITDVSEGSI